MLKAFKRPGFLLECLCDQQDSYSFPKVIRRRQLNTKVCGSKSVIFVNLSCYDHDVQQQYLANGLSTHRHLSTKLILITTLSSRYTQRLHNFKVTQQHFVVAVCCEGCHFLILYACAHNGPFPDQIPCSLVWE